MGRPPLWRRVNYIPQISYFKPAGVRLAQLQEICLAVEEVEAIRLKELEGLEQEECAQKMNISRTTFARVLTSARHKVADALLNGKAIRIEGGNFEMAPVRFRCAIGHEWGVPFDITLSEPPQYCPVCNTTNITSLQTPGGGWQSRSGRGRRRGWRTH